MRERVPREGRRSVRMKDNHNHIHATPLALALAVCWLVLIALPHSHSHSQPPPPLCGEQSYMCNISVSAILDPFWEQIPHSQCNGGDASSLLICYTVHEFQNFTVKKVNHTSHTMTVVPTHTVKDVCSPGFFEIYDNLNNHLLQYYGSVHNVMVFFDGCGGDIPDFPSKRKFKCGYDEYYFEEEYKEYEMLHRYPKLKQCMGRLLVATAAPLEQYDDSNDGAAVLKEALRDGFGVYYALPRDCTRCSHSNGICGSDRDVVSCKYYCPGQHCSQSTSPISLFAIPLVSYIFFIIYRQSLLIFIKKKKN